MKKLFAATTIVLGFAAFPALAESYPPVFKSLTDAGVKVVKSFPVGDGLTGWVIQHPSGESMITYTTASGQYLIAGAVFDKSGKNITQDHAAKHAPDSK